MSALPAHKGDRLPPPAPLADRLPEITYGAVLSMFSRGNDTSDIAVVFACTQAAAANALAKARERERGGKA